MNKWVTNYFSKSISKCISKDKELLKLLIEGVDVFGELIVTHQNVHTLPFIEFAKKKHGMVIAYNNLILAFFSEKLYCESTHDSLEESFIYLEKNQVSYGTSKGEILIGNLNKEIPVIAGIIITKATKSLKSDF